MRLRWRLAPGLLTAADRADVVKGAAGNPEPVVRPLPPVYSPDASSPPRGMSANGPLPTSPALPPGAVDAVQSGNGAEYESIRAGGSELMLIDLASAWRLAARQNPTIGLARQMVEENLANLLRQRDRRTELERRFELPCPQRQSAAIDGPDSLGTRDARLVRGGGAGAVGSQSVNIPAVQIVCATCGRVLYAASRPTGS